MRQTQALRVVGDYAADQWGMVTAAQAKNLGVDGITLARLMDSGLLTRVAHGVYGVSAAMTGDHLAERAAWLRLSAARPAWERKPLDRDGGVVSHRSAANIHQLGELVSDAVEITVPVRRTTRDPAVRLRTAHLTGDDVTRVDGLPVTTVERTIVDLLADHLDGGHIGDVLATAHRRQQIDMRILAPRVAPFAGRYGISAPDLDPGSALIGHLVEQVGGDPRDDHDRRLAELVTQLAELSPAQVEAISELVRSATNERGDRDPVEES